MPLSSLSNYYSVQLHLLITTSFKLHCENPLARNALKCSTGCRCSTDDLPKAKTIKYYEQSGHFHGPWSLAGGHYGMIRNGQFA